jgi:serine/threonine-protein kinase
MTAIGDVVGGGYRLIGIVGRGAMSTVYRAHDERLNRDVALKLLAPEFGQDFIYRARFEREYRLTALLNHPNIVQVYDAGEWNDQLYIVQKLIEGPNLAAVIQQESPLGLGRTVSIVGQVADALDEAHAQRVVHRDVKPANILLDPPSFSGTERAYLADFGLTLGMEGTHLTRTGAFMGTLAYAAPEQLGSGRVDGRADQYALACTTFQMLTGQPPFRRDNEFALINAHLFDRPPALAELRPDLPRRVGEVIARALSKKPDDRFPSAGTFARALAAAGGVAVARSSGAARGSGGARGSRSSRSSRMPLIAAGLAILAFVLVGGILVLAVVNGLSASIVPGATPPAVLSTGLVAAASPSTTVVPTSVASGPSASASALPTFAPSPSISGRSPRPTDKATQTPTPTPAPTPTATPSTVPPSTPPPNVPVLAAGSWNVANSLTNTNGNPYAPLGDHSRRYEVTPRCDSAADCRFSAVTYTSSGKRLGTISFNWNAGAYNYGGAASWYREMGGTTCQTAGGDLIANAYSVHEQVRVAPGSAGGPVSRMTGSKVISGTPTDAGTAAGCDPYSMTFDVLMTASQ